MASINLFEKADNKQKHVAMMHGHRIWTTTRTRGSVGFQRRYGHLVRSLANGLEGEGMQNQSGAFDDGPGRQGGQVKFQEAQEDIYW